MNMKFGALALLSASLIATSASACANKPPKMKWATMKSDVRVGGDVIEKLVAGQKVRFGSAYEHYKRNGSYVFNDGNRQHKPDGYKFYSSGVRCLNYQEPRYDLYVVNGDKLVLINANGGRFAVESKAISKKIRGLKIN
jgi:hypothetical protein